MPARRRSGRHGSRKSPGRVETPDRGRLGADPAPMGSPKRAKTFAKTMGRDGPGAARLRHAAPHRRSCPTGLSRPMASGGRRLRSAERAGTSRTMPGGSGATVPARRTRVAIGPSDDSRAWWIRVRASACRIKVWRTEGTRKEPASLPSVSSTAVEGETTSTSSSGSGTATVSQAIRAPHRRMTSGWYSVSSSTRTAIPSTTALQGRPARATARRAPGTRGP
jgi:hypothetical protein